MGGGGSVNLARGFPPSQHKGLWVGGGAWGVREAGGGGGAEWGRGGGHEVLGLDWGQA